MEETESPRKPWLVAIAVLVTVVVPAFLLFISVGNSQGPAAASIDTLLPNPDFENGLTGWIAGYADRDHDVPNQGYSVEVDHFVFHSGTASARIEAISPDAKPQAAYGHISTRIPADFFREKRVRLSAYLRTKSPGRTQAPMEASLYMSVAGTIEGLPTDPEIPLSSDGFRPGEFWVGDWEKQSIVLDIPKEADYVLFGIRVAGYGDAWLDGVKLEIVGSEVPTTDTQGRKTLENLDFEQGFAPWVKGLDLTTNIDMSDPTDIGTGPEMAHSGKLGAYIRHGPGTRDGIHYPILYGQYYRDKQVRVSAFLNVDDAPKGATLFFEAGYLDPNAKPYALTYGADQALPGRTRKWGWQQVSVTLNVPDRTWGMWFGVDMDGDGEVWIDDVQVEVLGALAKPGNDK